MDLEYLNNNSIKMELINKECPIQNYEIEYLFKMQMYVDIHKDTHLENIKSVRSRF